MNLVFSFFGRTGSSKTWYKWLFGTGKSKKHDAGGLFDAEKSHGSAAFVFFTANKWKCIAVCRSFALKDRKTLSLSVLWYAGAVMKGVNRKSGGKNRAVAHKSIHHSEKPQRYHMPGTDFDPVFHDIFFF